MLRSSTSRTPTWLFGYRFHLTRRSRPQPAPQTSQLKISTTLPMCTMRVKVGRCCLCSILDLLGPLRADVRRNATLDCMLIRLVGPIHVMDLGATMHTARANTIEFAVTRRQRIYRAQRFGYSSVFIWKMVRVNQDHDA